MVLAHVHRATWACHHAARFAGQKQPSAKGRISPYGGDRVPKPLWRYRAGTVGGGPQGAAPHGWGKGTELADPRHATSLRFGPPRGWNRAQGAPLLYRGARARTGLAELLATDHAEPSSGGRFRWLISTCLAATVG